MICRAAQSRLLNNHACRRARAERSTRWRRAQVECQERCGLNCVAPAVQCSASRSIANPSDPAGEVELRPSADALEVRTLLPLEAERLRVLDAIARTKLPVLLLGESGTGKEVLARRARPERSCWSEIKSVATSSRRTTSAAA